MTRVRIDDDTARSMHRAYRRGRTLAEIANHPTSRGVGIGRSEQMRVRRIRSAFARLGLPIRTSSEAQLVRAARRNIAGRR